MGRIDYIIAIDTTIVTEAVAVHADRLLRNKDAANGMTIKNMSWFGKEAIAVTTTITVNATNRYDECAYTYWYSNSECRSKI